MELAKRAGGRPRPEACKAGSAGATPGWARPAAAVVPASAPAGPADGGHVTPGGQSGGPGAAERAGGQRAPRVRNPAGCPTVTPRRQPRVLRAGGRSRRVFILWGQKGDIAPARGLGRWGRAWALLRIVHAVRSSRPKQLGQVPSWFWGGARATLRAETGRAPDAAAGGGRAAAALRVGGRGQTVRPGGAVGLGGGPRRAQQRSGAGTRAPRGGVAAVVAAVARLRGGGGPTAAAAPGLTKSRQPRASACGPGAGARPEGPEAAAPGPREKRGEEEALPAWAPSPGPILSASKPPNLDGFVSAPGPEPSPSRGTHSERRRDPRLPAAPRSSAGLKPLGHQSPGLVRPWPWPRLSLVGPQRQSPGVAPPLLQLALPVGPEHPSFLGPAPRLGSRSFPLDSAPSLAPPPPLPHPSALRPTPPRSCRPRAGLRQLAPPLTPAPRIRTANQRG
ncbi:uncharacterized protein LOC128929534 [Callithrix jacchus]